MIGLTCENEKPGTLIFVKPVCAKLTCSAVSVVSVVKFGSTSPNCFHFSPRDAVLLVRRKQRPKVLLQAALERINKAELYHFSSRLPVGTLPW